MSVDWRRLLDTLIGAAVVAAGALLGGLAVTIIVLGVVDLVMILGAHV